MHASNASSAFCIQARAAHPASALAMSIALFCAAPVWAAQPAGDEPSSSWGLGLGVASSKKAYTGFDRENTLLPILQFENKYVKVFGPGVEVKLPGLRLGDTQKLNFGLVGELGFSGYEAKDSYIFTGMRERKDGVWAGAKMEWENNVANVTAAWKGDVSGHSKGQMLSLGVERTWRVGERLMLTPRAIAMWHDSKYNDYYYGVRTDEARSGRASYLGKSGTNAELGLRSIYRFDRQHSVFMDVSVTSLSSAVKDSPLVDRSTENRIMLGYTYRFR